MEMTPIHERLQAAVGKRTFRALAEITGTNAETVRRYMQGQPPSVEFLAAVCRVLGVNAQWLLTGEGPMRVSEIRSRALSEANPAELLAATAGTLERLTERVQRLETFLQVLEARLRGATTNGRGPGDHKKEVVDGEGSAAEVVVRTRAVADAVAERPRQDAR